MHSRFMSAFAWSVSLPTFIPNDTSLVPQKAAIVGISWIGLREGPLALPI